MTNGWIRPLQKDAWHLIPQWRHIHEFMSVQAGAVGALALTAFIHVGYSNTVILVTLGLTVAGILIGILTDQPELNNYEPDATDTAS